MNLSAISQRIALSVFVMFVCTAFVQAQISDVTPDDYQRALHWADSTMRKMDGRQRAAQLFMVNVASQQNAANRKAVHDYIADMGLGGIYFSKGTLEEHVAMNNLVVRFAEVPAIIGFDGEWGLAMRIKSIPSFPHNDILGCISDDSLITEMGRMIGRQCRMIGVDIDFAPVADINTNPDNPVIGWRSFGEDRNNVSRKAIAFATGLEQAGVLSVSKHFPGHGDTSQDSHKLLPTVGHSRARLDSIELYPFEEIARAGLHGMMVGHLYVPAIESVKGLPSSLSPAVHDVLRDDIGFKGLVFTDALAMKGVAGYENVCLKAIEAGNDVVLSPVPVKPQLDAVVHAARHDRRLAASIDERCRRILAFKYLLGVHEKRAIDADGLYDRIADDDMHDLIRRLYCSAVTVVSDCYSRLPVMRHGQRVAVVSFGSPAEGFCSEMKQYAEADCLTFSSLAAFEAASDTLSRYATVLLPVTSATPDWALKAAGMVPRASRVFVFFVSRKDVRHWSALSPASSAMVMANAAHDYLQRHVARVICGLRPADGRLSMTIPGVANAGAGITFAADTVTMQASPEAVGMNPDVLSEIDEIAIEGIRQKAYPGCQILVIRDGVAVYDKCFGQHEYGDSRLVRNDDVYDVASMTKTSATLLAVMKLYDQHRLRLSDRVGDILPWLKGTDKEDITIADLLYHESGLKSSLPFFAAALDSATFEPPFFKYGKDEHHDRYIGSKTYVPSDFGYDGAYLGMHYNTDYHWQVSDNMFVNDAYHERALGMIAASPLGKHRYSYSCVGFIILKEIVETLTGEGMDTYLDRLFYHPMGLRHTFFNPLKHCRIEGIVPTVTDDFLHRGRLQGYVHDDSAAFFGGVSGNAGLFSNAHDLGHIYQMLLSDGFIDGHVYISPSTCRLFTTSKSRISRRGLGFDRSYEGDNRGSPCSPLTPGGVYGHTGFTGTCVWVDPSNDLIYIFLSNRVYPDGTTNKLAGLGIRSRIQDTIYRSLGVGTR